MFKKSLFTVLMLAAVAIPYSAKADFGSIGFGPGAGGYLPPYNDGGYYNPGYCSVDYNKANQIVYALYNGILFRTPDQGGLNMRVNEFVTRGPSVIAQHARDIAESPEFHQNIAYRYSPRQIVTQMYRGLLGRNPDPQGLQGWVQLARQGRFGEVAAGIAGSQEFNQRFGLCL